MKRQGILASLGSLAATSAVVLIVVLNIGYDTRFVGPALLLLGFLPWVPIRLAGRSVRSTGADIIFGAVDTGFLAVAALIGAELGGIFGAVVGGLVGDAITDGLAGVFEGRAAEYLRLHNIHEERTPMSASMGKLSGCLLGAGTTLTVAWTILGFTLG